MSHLLRTLIVCLLACGWAAGAALRAPSDLKVEVLGANAFLLKWKDNSTDEVGFQILASLGSNSTPADYISLPGADRKGYLMISNDIPGKSLRLQVKAYRGDGELIEYSKASSIVEVKAVDEAVFLAPENLRATSVDESRIRLRWNDLSTTEAGYFIQMRTGKGEWQDLGNTGIEKRYNIVIQSLNPSTSYTFRVAAFKSRADGQIASVSPLSNESTAKTDVFRAPFDLRAKSEGEGMISLSWKERSSIEEGIQVQAKEGDKKFKSLGKVAANTTSTSPIFLALATSYDFRVRSFRTVKGKEVYSKFSNVASRKSTGLAIPSDLKVASTTESSVTLTWKDVSTREEGYTLRYKEKGKKLPIIVELPAGAATHTVTGLKVGKYYNFQVRAFDENTVSRYTPVVEGTTRDQLLGNYDVSLTAGESFFFDIEVNEPAQVDQVTASNLPAGLTLDENSLSISGIVTTPGLYQANVKVRFKAGYEVERTLVLRIVAQEGGPVTEVVLANIQVGNGATKDVFLNGKFRDSDVSVARRFTTNLGAFDIVLFEDATPQTVENFLAYADGGRYVNTFFHRAPVGFVVQGGGFTYNGSAFGKVNTFAPVQNEPGISNLEGTVAMAKLGSDPNSATSQFFINLSDANASNLDFQNEGFTVFGRIVGNNMELFQEIDAMPKGSYTISPGGDDIDLDDVPVNTSFPAPATLDPSKLVRVTKVEASPILTFTATSLNPGIASVSITGNTLRVSGVMAGTARIRVRATDLDGLFSDQLFDVIVP